MSNNHTFKIMSLNLLTSGARLPGNPPFSIRIHAIQSMLQEYDPDIIGVQELTAGMFPYMSNILERYEIFGDSRHSLVSNEYSSILFKKDRYTFLDGKTLWLSREEEKKGSKYPLSQFPRIVTYVYLKDNKTNQTLTVFNTHLDANFPFVRTQQSKVLSKIILKYQKGDYTLLCGDFNCTRLSAAFLLLNRTHLRDLIDDSFGSTLRGDVGSMRYHHLPIDHILVSDNLSVQTAVKITYPYDSVYPTDHFPVIAQMTHEGS